MTAASADFVNSSPEPGYYPDPSIPGYVRYWNGVAWVPGTSRRAPRDGEPQPSAPAWAAALEVPAEPDRPAVPSEPEAPGPEAGEPAREGGPAADDTPERAGACQDTGEPVAERTAAETETENEDEADGEEEAGEEPATGRRPVPSHSAGEVSALDTLLLDRRNEAARRHADTDAEALPAHATVQLTRPPSPPRPRTGDVTIVGTRTTGRSTPGDAPVDPRVATATTGRALAGESRTLQIRAPRPRTGDDDRPTATDTATDTATPTGGNGGDDPETGAAAAHPRRTAPAPRAPHRPAAPARRAAARALDAVVVWGVAAAVGLSVTGPLSARLALAFPAYLLAGLLWEALPTARQGCSPAQRLLGLRLVEDDRRRRPAAAPAVLRRWLVRALLAPVLVGLVDAALALRGGASPHRCLHDRVAGTLLVDVRSSGTPHPTGPSRPAREHRTSPR